MTGISWALRRGTRRVRSALVGLLARDTDRDPASAVAVLGTARSGTTWLGDLLADGLRARVLFEPFNPDRVRAAAGFGSMPYRRPDARDDALRAFCQKVFDGRLRSLWVDREARWLRPRGRVVKSVRAHLMLGWLAREFPAVSRVLIVREPLAVVRSRLAAGWAPEPDIDAMLGNPQLVQDHLGAEYDWARGLATPEERTALIWALHYRIALAQAGETEGTVVVFYEDIVADPERSLGRIFAAFGRGAAGSAARASRPSSTTRPGSTVLAQGERRNHDCRLLHPRAVARVRAIVERLELGHLYRAGARPTREEGDRG